MAAVAFSVPNSRSVRFDGDGDYLFTTPIPFTNSGNFTIEFWFKTNSSNLLQGLFFSGTTGLNDRRIQLEILTNGALSLYMQVTTANQSVVSAAGLINADTWYHVAFVRQSPVYVIYLNGTQVASALISVTLSNTDPNNLYIGLSRSSSILRYLNGYISNFRVVNGSPVYTRDSFADFTPPTQPLYPIQNTTFLTCQSPTIIDKSYNPLTITVGGNARVDDENPFGFSTSTSVVVSNNAFDITSIENLAMTEVGNRVRQATDIYQLLSPVTLLPNISATTEAVTSFKRTITRINFGLFRLVSADLSLTNDIGSDENGLATRITPAIVKTLRTEKISSLKISVARTVQANTQTVSYSYWV
jgi:hypothetical protein